MSTLFAMLKRSLRALGPLLITAIFLGAIWLLYGQIRKYSLEEIRLSVELIPLSHLLLSTGLMILNYAILVGYDWLAIRGINKKLSAPRVTLVSFVGQAVSYNFGALLGGTTVRYRFYSAWDFSPLDIVRLVLMLAVTFWVGALGLVGTLFMIVPPTIPPELMQYIPFESLRGLGGALVLIAASYLVLCYYIKKPLTIFGKEFAFPPFHIAVAQAIVAGADLVVAGACLYVLLPSDSGISFLTFLPNYLMGMVMVVLSHVPGGVGVLEVVIMHLTTIDPKAVFAALLCFRVIYYLIPLLLAAILFAVYEIHYQTRQASGALHDVGRWIHTFSSTLMAYALFVCGALISVAVMLPTSASRLTALQNLEPAVVQELAHLLLTACGLLMMFLAPSLRERKYMACRCGVWLLGLAVLGLLLSSMNWPLALFCLLILFCVLSIQHRCYRRSSIWATPLNRQWFGAMILVLLGTTMLGNALFYGDPQQASLLTTFFFSETPLFIQTALFEGFILATLLIQYRQTAPLRKKQPILKKNQKRVLKAKNKTKQHKKTS